MRNHITAWVLVCFLSSCGAVIDPASLRRAAPGQSIELPKGYVYISPPAGVYDNQFKYELAPGVYAAEFEDDEGTYYRGPAGGVGASVYASKYEKQPLNRVAKSEGGVFVPRKSSDEAKIYFYRWTTAQSTLSPTATTEIAARATPNASVGAAAAGGAIGMGIAEAIIESERGKIGFMPSSGDGSLRNAIVFRK